jgi:hypothetical protein
MSGPTPPEVFRNRRTVFRLSLVALLLFTFAAAASAVVMYSEARPGRKALVAAGFALLWSPFVGLGAWGLLAFWRESVAVGGGQVRFNGVVRRRAVRLADVTRARWEPAGGSLTLFFEGGSQKVRLGEFRGSGRLLRLLRGGIDPERQAGWCVSLERQLATADQGMSPERYDRLFRWVWWLGGPVMVLPLCVTLLLHYRDGVELRHTTGSAFADWTLLWLLAVGVPLGSLRVLKWVCRPEP